MPRPLRVMISSTVLDLPDHRKAVLDACLRQGVFPVMMEHPPVSGEEAISASHAMVDQVDVYVGVFAQRYGFEPPGHSISITEMEYDRAVERKIPRLIFLMGDDHPVKAKDVDKGESAKKLEAFKERARLENVVSFFNSPAELGGHVIDRLSKLRDVLTEQEDDETQIDPLFDRVFTSRFANTEEDLGVVLQLRRAGFPGHVIVPDEVYTSCWRRNPDTMKIIYDESSKPVGYWSIIPINSESFDQFTKGNVSHGEMMSQRCLPWRPDSAYL